MSFSELEKQFANIAAADGVREVMNAFLDLGLDIIITFFVGGLFYGSIFAVLGYFTGARLVRLYRIRKEQRKAARKQMQQEQ